MVHLAHLCWQDSSSHRVVACWCSPLGTKYAQARGLVAYPSLRVLFPALLLSSFAGATRPPRCLRLKQRLGWVMRMLLPCMWRWPAACLDRCELGEGRKPAHVITWAGALGCVVQSFFVLNICAPPSARAHLCADTLVHTHMHTHVHTHTHKNMLAYMRIHTRANTRMHIHKRVRTHTHAHTRTAPRAHASQPRCLSCDPAGLRDQGPHAAVWAA